jgi:NADH-quinone oxidoreductase subunit L
MTHAFFKALLFLGSGSVIHAMGGEQDIRIMGGLGKKMRITQITFLIGCLAIAGIPGFSGFFSKDEILASAFSHNKAIYWLGILGAMMTAFYMFRLYTLTFSGKFRGTHEQEHHLHESPAAMTIPLIILAVLSVIGGYVGLPAVFSEHHALGSFLSSSVTNAGTHEVEHSTEWMLLGISTAVAIIFSIMGWAANRKPAFTPNTGFANVLENKWYVDELYNAIIVRPLSALSALMDRFVERMGIDGIVNGVGKGVRFGGDRVRLLQNGQVGFYIFVMVIGITAVFALSFFWIK